MLDILIVVFIVGSIFLSIQPLDAFRPYAPIVGMVGQPLSLYAMFSAGESGMLVVAAVCTLSWSVGLQHYWLKRYGLLSNLMIVLMGFFVLIFINVMMHLTISLLDYTIAILSGGAILLTQIDNNTAKRYASIIGLSGQPFCLYVMLASGEMGMLIVVIITTLLWAWDAWGHWKGSLHKILTLNYTVR